MTSRRATPHTHAHARALSRRAAACALFIGAAGGCASQVAQAPAPAEVIRAELAHDAEAAEEPSESARPLLRTHVASARSTAEFQAFTCYVPGSECAPSAPLASCPERLRPHDWANEHARMLQLADDTDFLELTVVEGEPGSHVAITPDQLGVWAKAGSECAGASDHPACMRALGLAKSELRQEASCNGKPCTKPTRVFGVLTRGDRVQKLRGAADFRALLGTIDTPAEAWLMLMLASDRPYFSCNDATRARHRKVPGHYELVSLQVTSYCESDTPRTVHREFSYRVDPSGAVQRTQAAVVAVAKNCAGETAPSRGTAQEALRVAAQ